MTGVVAMVSKQNGFIALERDGEFTIVEITGTHEPELGDKISGNLRNLGSEPLRNETQKTNFDAIIQDFDCDVERAKQLLSSN